MVQQVHPSAAAALVDSLVVGLADRVVVRAAAAWAVVRDGQAADEVAALVVQAADLAVAPVRAVVAAGPVDRRAGLAAQLAAVVGFAEAVVEPP